MFLRISCLSLALSTTFGMTAVLTHQNLRDLARQHAVRNPDVPLQQPAPPADYRPKAIEELTREADVVLVARLIRVKSYLGPGEDRILTAYSVVGATVIAGRLSGVSTPAPGPVAPLIITVYGGEATVEGVLVRGTDNNRDRINDGAQYVLFLKESRAALPGRYEIYYGGIFEIAGDRIRPLIKRADDVFEGTPNTDVTAFLSRIRTVGSLR